MRQKTTKLDIEDEGEDEELCAGEHALIGVSCVRLVDLADDSVVSILSYLSAEEVLGMSLCNRRLLELSRESYLWFGVCARRWALLEDLKGQKVTFHDESRKDQDPHMHTPNLPLLYGMTQPHPTQIEPSFLKPKWRRSRRRTTKPEFRAFDVIAGDSDAADAEEPISVIQFTGETGCGDRCIRADKPFPILEVPPDCLNHQNHHNQTREDDSADADSADTDNYVDVDVDGLHTNPGARWCPHLILDFIRGVVAAVGLGSTPTPTITRTSSFVSTAPRHCQQIIKTATLLPPELILPQHTLAQTSFLNMSNTIKPSVILRPFVAPFAMSSSYNSNHVKETNLNVTPRLFAYYEVTILHRDYSQEPPMPSATPSDHHDAPPNNDPPSASPSDCIAIGLSTSSFQLAHKMPGWDASSYGYHSDDGGIFHSNGDMVRPFGPSFGCGDTVGCGIDYVQRSIFYTLNGSFLGYAFENVPYLCPPPPPAVSISSFSFTSPFYKNDTHGVSHMDATAGRGLYPTIGMDSNCPIACNFGERPFVFDVGLLMVRHKELIETAFHGFPCNNTRRSSSKVNHGSVVHEHHREEVSWVQ